MALGKPSSFRRILLSRLFFLSVPILLTGVYLTYSKTRSTFVEIARHNLTDSAIRKGESIRQSINEVYANLTIASGLKILKSDAQANNLVVISRLTEILPDNILCVHLSDPRSSKIVASNCDEVPSLDFNLWPQQKQTFFTPRQQIQVDVILPTTTAEQSPKSPQVESQNQLKLWLTAPVYDLDNELRYTLTVKSAILAPEFQKPGSLDGYPVVINEKGVILTHRVPQRIERNIKQLLDNDSQQLLDNNSLEKFLDKIAKQPDTSRPFFLEKYDVEFLAGYSLIISPINPEKSQKWVILAVTPLSQALSPLKGIRRVLMVTYVLISIGSIIIVFRLW